MYHDPNDVSLWILIFHYHWNWVALIVLFAIAGVGAKS